MERFRWAPSEEASAVARSPETAFAVAAEVAKIGMFAEQFATILHIDIAAIHLSDLLTFRCDRSLRLASRTPDEHDLLELIANAADAIDLLLFAYAKAENIRRDPEADYDELREDRGGSLLRST